MKNEDKIAELLSALLIKQDSTEAVLEKLVVSFEKMGGALEKLTSIQERQEKILINILEVLADDVPKFDELIELEQVEGGKKVVLRKSR